VNKEEILAMEAGRELDAAVAETVFGWYDISLMTNSSNNFTNYQGFSPGIHSRRKIKNYSTDISAAWEVAEKFQTYQVTKTHQVNLPNGLEDMYRAIVKANKFVAYARTAPLAICRAALLAVMEEN
jgi:uncharacterized protein YjaG (DUF416 family)